MDLKTLKEECHGVYPNHYGFYNQHDFARDVRRFYVIKKMCIRYNNKGVINHRHFINQFIVLTNVFGVPYVLSVFSRLFNENEKRVLYAFTNWLGLTKENHTCTQIQDLLKDMEKRLK